MRAVERLVRIARRVGSWRAPLVFGAFAPSLLAYALILSDAQAATHLFAAGLAPHVFRIAVLALTVCAACMIRQVWIWMCAEKLRLPNHRFLGAPLRWIPPSYHAVRSILDNPIYAGVYRCGRTRQERSIDPGGRLSIRKRGPLGLPFPCPTRSV